MVGGIDGLVVQDLEAAEDDGAEQERRDEPDTRRLDEARQPDDRDRGKREVATAGSIVLHRRDGTRGGSRG